MTLLGSPIALNLSVEVGMAYVAGEIGVIHTAVAPVSTWHAQTAVVIKVMRSTAVTCFLKVFNGVVVNEIAVV